MPLPNYRSPRRDPNSFALPHPARRPSHPLGVSNLARPSFASATVLLLDSGEKTVKQELPRRAGSTWVNFHSIYVMVHVNWFSLSTPPPWLSGEAKPPLARDSRSGAWRQITWLSVISTCRLVSGLGWTLSCQICSHHQPPPTPGGVFFFFF